ncbi:MAG: DNA-binding MarR family transcriptional regulator [Gammaproteobacteria bacterium]|jgi:DNA-binding MarR family transcriptional regulator
MENITSPLTFLIQLSSLQTFFLKSISQHLGEHGIGFTEFLILHYLQDTQGEAMRRGDLAGHLGLSVSSVTRLLMPMQKIGLIQKEVSPEKAHSSLVTITSAGKKARTNAAVTIGSVMSELTKSLCPEQLNSVARCFEGQR